MTITIGIDPHKASHTAVAIDDTEHVVDEIRVRACSAQTDQLRCWATPFPDRVWAIESARGLGYLLAQQLVAAGETVVDVPPCCRHAPDCWDQGAPRRTTRTTPDQSRSPRYAMTR
jgi:transposase